MLFGQAAEMEFQYQLGDAVKVVRLEREGELLRAAIEDRVYEVRVLRRQAGEWSL